jgi:predicted O-methyltransferase YrrM
MDTNTKWFSPRRLPSWAIASLVASLAVVGSAHCKNPPAPTPGTGAGGAWAAAMNDGGAVYGKSYAFSEDWFSDRVASWSQLLGPLRGRQNLNYLEIGVFEGRSALWMLENILTHPSARMTALDIFLGNTRAVWNANLDKSGFGSKVTTIQGPSGEELRKLPLRSFDVIYIDGSHTADDVLADAVLGWGLLREGGLMIFDDYAWSGRLKVGEEPTPDELRPKVAIDAFITTHRNYLEVVVRDWQVAVRKHGGLCSFKEGCTPIGAYEYHWWTAELMRRNDLGKVELTERERGLLEKLLRSRGFGQAQYEPDAALKSQPGYGPLMERLGLQI